MSDGFNPQLVLIAGRATCGKSASLRNIREPEKWLYLNTEAGKRLPFKSKFQEANVLEPEQVIATFDYAASASSVKGVIIDSLTFLMNMYENMHVVTASDTQRAWGEYGQFFTRLMLQAVMNCPKPIIFTAHVGSDLDKQAMEIRTSVPIKGATKKIGVEAYFSTVVYAKKAPITLLEEYSNHMLNITDKDRAFGYKYVFQTMLTPDTINETIRSPMDLFQENETYIDNDCQILLDHLQQYYN